MVEKGYEFIGNKIVIDRELTNLDLFVKDFLEIITRYTDYLVVSGFVSISTGRTRATEDVDIIFPNMEKEKFRQLFNDLENNKFWCYQSDNYEEAFEYIKDMESIRFARVGEMIPNIEFIPFNDTRPLKKFEFDRPQKIKIKDFEFKIPELEFEINYKEIILASKKDLEDARHLKTIFSKIINEEKLKRYKELMIKYSK